MNLLAPLYIAGALAVALPIIFHLIKRTPQGRVPFSSLMFLMPSPPRITKRSRLSNILLLLLRAAALTLLAIAFARPFFHQKVDAAENPGQQRKLAIMVDVSASMQRGDLWEQAKKQVDAIAATLQPTDTVALYVFDRQARAVLSFAEWEGLDFAHRSALLRGTMTQQQPGFGSTNLAAALSSVADELAGNETAGKETGDKIARQIILISDLQQGGHAEALQGYQWPANVLLDARPVALKNSTNAALQLIHSSSDALDPQLAGKLNVRVSNQPDGSNDQFTLTWADAQGPAKGVEPLKVYVTPGHSQVVHMEWPTSQPSADRVVLAGDDADFDNTLFVVPPRQQVQRVMYLGADRGDDVDGLRFYLERALAPSPSRDTRVEVRSAAVSLAADDLSDVRLLIVGNAQSDERIAVLRAFAEGGGTILWVIRDPAAADGLAKLLGSNGLSAAESGEAGFSLLGKVSLDDPVFSAFSDARFADFTKIHFWKHRKLTPAVPADTQVLAAFDDGDPFLLAKTIGKGRLLITTSGWQPGDSQLALSTKFVPLLDGLLNAGQAGQLASQYMVGDPIAVPTTRPGETRSVISPDGTISIPAPAAGTYDGAERPGIYHVKINQQSLAVAVNLPPDESRTTPIAADELARWGAKLGDKPLSDESLAKQRQLQLGELENRQKVWRWLIVAVLAILAAETLLAGRLARRRQTAELQVSA